LVRILHYKVSLLLISTILALAAGTACVFIIDRVLNTPIAHVDVEGALDEREMEIVRRKLSEQDLSKATIRELKPLLEEMGWILHVNVRKVWPDVLKVQVIKQKAVANWGKGSYLNGDGQLFADELQNETKLPSLKGPTGAEKRVMAQFQQLNKALQKTGLSIHKLTLEDRGEWVLQLRNAVIVKLGKENIFERMQRLIKVYQAVGLAEKVSGIAEIDTRYPNGVAVSWKDDKCLNGCYEFAGNNIH